MANISDYEIGSGLKVSEDGVLSVDATDDATKDDKRPITSHGVAVKVGNLEALLSTV